MISNPKRRIETRIHSIYIRTTLNKGMGMYLGKEEDDLGRHEVILGDW